MGFFNICENEYRNREKILTQINARFKTHRGY